MDSKEYNKKYYEKHRRRRLAQQKAYYYRNVEKRREYQRDYDREKRHSDNDDTLTEETDT